MPFTTAMFDTRLAWWRWEMQLLATAIVLLVGLGLLVYSITRLRRSRRGSRSEPRRPLAGPIEVRWKYSPGLEWRSIGRCLDVCSGGLKMELPDPIQVFERIRFQVLQSDLAGTASVRHCSRVGTNYVIGVKFDRRRRNLAS